MNSLIFKIKNLVSRSIFPVLLLLASCSKEVGTPSSYLVNEAASSIEWKGSAPDHYHLGSFKVFGSLHTGTNDMIKSGSFVIPIASIDNFDLQGEVKKQLLDHLKSPDFFNMVLHPEAKFEILKSEAYTVYSEKVMSGVNTLLTGKFTMLGQTHPITFPAKVIVNKSSIVAEANLKIDRTKWGMTYDSDPSKPLYILPEVELKIKLVTSKSGVQELDSLK